MNEDIEFSSSDDSEIYDLIKYPNAKYSDEQLNNMKVGEFYSCKCGFKSLTKHDFRVHKCIEKQEKIPERGERLRRLGRSIDSY